MTGPPDLLVALDAIDLQLAAGSDEVVLPRDAAELVACALHDLLGERGRRLVSSSRSTQAASNPGGASSTA